MTELARSYEITGRLAEAEAVRTLALKIHERDAVQNSVAIAQDLVALAQIAAVRNKLAEGEAHLARSQKIARIVFGDVHSALIRFQLAWGEAAWALGRPEAAVDHYERADRLAEKGPEGIGERGNVWARRGHLERAAGRFRSALDYYRQALEAHEKTEGSGGLSVGRDWLFIGRAHAEEGRFRKADAAFKRSVSIRENALGPEHPDAAESWAARADGWEQEIIKYKTA